MLLVVVGRRRRCRGPRPRRRVRPWEHRAVADRRHGWRPTHRLPRLRPSVLAAAALACAAASLAVRDVLDGGRQPARAVRATAVAGIAAEAPQAPIPAAPAADRWTWTVFAAGDVAGCFNDVAGQPELGQHPGQGAIRTAALIRARLPVDDLIVLGDLAYESGAPAEFRDCYDPTWGAFNAFAHPTPGNHEYRTPDAAGYFGYWGARAGPPGRGYYSYDLGPWHIISLNSEEDVAPSGDQAAWLRADLAAHPRRCTMAFWHRPRYSSDPVHGDAPALAGIFEILYDAGVDVLLQGHAHAYERWAELGPDGTVRPGRGVRTFVIGTGGAETMPVGMRRPGEDVLRGHVLGVLEMVLTADWYSWRFASVPGAPFIDFGRSRCH